MHKRKHTIRSKRQEHRAPTTSSNWDETVRATVDNPPSPAQPKVPPAEASESDDAEIYEEPKAEGDFSPGEVGQPGPLDQEGEGDRQNDQLEELEEIDAESDLKRRL